MLGANTVGTTATTIYTVPTGRSASVSIFIHNTDQVTHSVTISLSDGVNTYNMLTTDVAAKATVQISQIGLTGGDSVVATADTAGVVNVIVTGVEV